ncbi:uncharacterized protein TNCV_2351551 [Trichonephila clavipes]|nr:uncharacterized protein TNCV_2351551 [Trichonephila clavipes]
MSSRMEHLTISFFAVLEEREQRNLRENLISSRYECPKCGKNMVMRERKGTIDGYEWRCRTKGGENPHDVCKSIRKDFSQLQLKDNLEQYFHQKLNYGRQLVLSPQLIFEGLTDGMPTSIKQLMTVNPSTSPTEWLKVATR